MSKAGEVYNVPRGTAYLTTQQIITYTTYLIFYVALARILRPDEVGQVSLLLAAQAAFVALTQLGLPSAATRYISYSRGLRLILAYLGYRVTGIVSGWLLGGLAAVLLSSYLWHGQLPERNTHPIKPLLAFSLPVFGSALIAFGQQYGDITILQAIIGQLSTTGAYYLIVSSV